MKYLRKILALATIALSMVRADAALVASDGELILTGDLATVLSTGGSNLLSLTIPRSSMPLASSYEIVILSASNEVLAAATMMAVQSNWAAYFRSPSNAFTTFGGNPSTVLNFSYLALGQPNVMFQVGPIAGDIGSPPAIPPVGVLIGQQNLEYLAFTSGSEPRIVAQNLAFVPEPTTAALLVFGALGLVGMRRSRIAGIESEAEQDVTPNA